MKPYLNVLGFKVGEKDREAGTETGVESGLGGDAWILVEEKNASRSHSSISPLPP